MPTKEFLKATAEGTQLSIKLQPRASRQAIVGLHGIELKVSVMAPPVEAAANRALVEYLAEVCGCPRSAVELVRGQTSRHKVVLIRGVPLEKVWERLQPHLP